ncbi:putative 4-hydroxy-2-oxovalerate aldolase [Microdochium trichocladiopsis]|uniref:4-hydroxy-2-oxovalerate aldolase n=1 Tax=Microdochium trichocladiopsis TaxID=1682393 RepID=A0A9P8Y8A0_9PEZI|nr:putative 4-hydroxy-2-oxovalerate aldolase [Microdochium trichocladiopsis]KAH7031693.1 putative 4-hydroxy-2-oxovalerate aldolase [Microdochium trichocladiopsis]
MGSVGNTTAPAAAAAPPAKTWAISNPFRDAIVAGEVCPVFTTRMTTSAELPMVLKMAGAKALFIDMEHSAFDMHAVAQQILACNYAGVSAIVRIPSKSHWHISRMLDSGAAAIVVPHVETVEEVRQLVKDAKYAPIGARGCSNMQPLFNFGLVPTKVQNEILNRETMLIPMIETPGAVDLVDEFLAVEGVDGILIGSNDLCSDMGIPGQYDTAQYQDAITKIVLAGKKVGKPIGIGGIGGRLDLLEKWFNMGATWSLSGGDLASLQAAIKKIGENYSAINERVQKAKAAASS